MCNKIIRLFTTTIFSLIPFFLLAEKIETQISADTITVEKGVILHAEGNVIVQYGNKKIKAKGKSISETRVADVKNSRICSYSFKILAREPTVPFFDPC